MLRQLSLIERRALPTLTQRVFAAPTIPTATRRLTQTKNFLSAKKVKQSHSFLLSELTHALDVYCF